MGVTPNDRPQIKLELKADGLLATWGPIEGPFGIFNKSLVSTPKNVVVKEWCLYVGTKPKHGKDDESSRCEIVSRSFLGTQTEMFIPRELLPLNHQVLAQVIGYFDSKNEEDHEFVEGIFSDVARKHIK